MISIGMVRARELTGIVAAAVCLVAVASPATAETIERGDRLGDAPASIDVVHATYVHTRNSVRVVARLPHLGRGGVATLTVSRFESLTTGYVLRISNRPLAPPRTRLLFLGSSGLEPRRCSALSGTWAGEFIRLSVARTCLVGHIQEEVSARFDIRHGRHADHVSAALRLSRS